MNASIRLLAEPVRTLAFGSIVAGYTGIGTGLTNPCRIVFIQNLTDSLLMFSMDGVDDHFPLPSNGYMILDVTGNSNTNLQGFYISRGQRFYVKQIGVPTSGSVYVSAFYGAE
jgi:hypothetical protein